MPERVLDNSQLIDSVSGGEAGNGKVHDGQAGETNYQKLIEAVQGSKAITAALGRIVSEQTKINGKNWDNINGESCEKAIDLVRQAQERTGVLFDDVYADLMYSYSEFTSRLPGVVDTLYQVKERGRQAYDVQSGTVKGLVGLLISTNQKLIKTDETEDTEKQKEVFQKREAIENGAMINLINICTVPRVSYDGSKESVNIATEAIDTSIINHLDHDHADSAIRLLGNFNKQVIEEEPYSNLALDEFRDAYIKVSAKVMTKLASQDFELDDLFTDQLVFWIRKDTSTGSSRETINIGIEAVKATVLTRFEHNPQDAMHLLVFWQKYINSLLGKEDFESSKTSAQVRLLQGYAETLIELSKKISKPKFMTKNAQAGIYNTLVIGSLIDWSHREGNQTKENIPVGQKIAPAIYDNITNILTVKPDYAIDLLGSYNRSELDYLEKQGKAGTTLSGCAETTARVLKDKTITPEWSKQHGELFQTLFNDLCELYSHPQFNTYIELDKQILESIGKAIESQTKNRELLPMAIALWDDIRRWMMRSHELKKPDRVVNGMINIFVDIAPSVIYPIFEPSEETGGQTEGERDKKNHDDVIDILRHCVGYPTRPPVIASVVKNYGFARKLFKNGARSVFDIPNATELNALYTEGKRKIRVFNDYDFGDMPDNLRRSFAKLLLWDFIDFDNNTETVIITEDRDANGKISVEHTIEDFIGYYVGRFHSLDEPPDNLPEDEHLQLLNKLAFLRLSLANKYAGGDTEAETNSLRVALGRKYGEKDTVVPFRQKRTTEINDLMIRDTLGAYKLLESQRTTPRPFTDRFYTQEYNKSLARDKKIKESGEPKTGLEKLLGFFNS